MLGGQVFSIWRSVQVGIRFNCWPHNPLQDRLEENLKWIRTMSAPPVHQNGGVLLELNSNRTEALWCVTGDTDKLPQAAWLNEGEKNSQFETEFHCRQRYWCRDQNMFGYQSRFRFSVRWNVWLVHSTIKVPVLVVECSPQPASLIIVWINVLLQFQWLRRRRSNLQIELLKIATETNFEQRSHWTLEGG